MRGLEKILDSINLEAILQSEKILAQAKEKSNEILDQARKKSTAAALELVAQAEKQAKNLLEIEESAALLQKKQLTLAAHNENIENIILATKNYILKMNDTDYFDLILEMIDRFCWPNTKGEIIFSRKDLKRIPRGFKTNTSRIAKEKNSVIKVSSLTRNIGSGFILVYGNVEENCTIDSIFKNKYDDIVKIVYAC